jgi:hypothetical protein
MSTFLEQTIDIMVLADLAVADIEFIGSCDGIYRCTWEEFCDLADFEIDLTSFGGPTVVADLVIIYKGGTRMRLDEYDGSQSWQVTTPHRFDQKHRKITTLLSKTYMDTFAEVHK